MKRTSVVLLGVLLAMAACAVEAPPTATPTVARPTATTAGSVPPTPVRSPVASSVATGPVPTRQAQAEPWLIDGQAVTAVALGPGGGLWATTARALYGVAGGRADERSSDGPWPNLVAAGPATLLSGAPAPCGRGGPGTPIRRSVDGGRTWQSTRLLGGRTPTLAGRPVATVQGLLALACDGLYQSEDQGVTWQRQALVEPGSEPIDLAASTDGRWLYLLVLVGEGGTTRLLAAERQPGGRWSAPRQLRDDWGGGAITVGYEAGRPVLYSGGPLGLQVSRDEGASWRPLNDGLDTTRLLVDPRTGPLPPAEEAKLRTGAAVLALASRGDPPVVLLGGVDGLYRLLGGRWEHLPALKDQVVRHLAFGPDGLAYASTDLGVYRLSGL